MRGLHELLDRYRSGTYECDPNRDDSFQCGSFLLGALTKGMDSLKLLTPRPEVPFECLSFKGLCKNIRTMKSPAWLSNNSGHDEYGGFGSRHPKTHPCTLKTAIDELVEAASATIVGSDFIRLKMGEEAATGQSSF
jgi:hypothetical protein